MAGEWRDVSIDEIASEIAMGPFGSDIKTDNFVPTGVPVIRGGNLTAGRFHSADFVFLTEEKADELAKANALPGDLVFTHRGTLGQVGIVPAKPFRRYVVSQSQMKMTCDPKSANPAFMYYFFKSPAGQHALLMNTSQTGVPAISRPVTSLRSIRLSLPPLPEQRAIAHILGTLDDKIELNRRMNETLEAMARALFQSWFVDFDPVRAKAAGRDPGLPQPVANLFPDRFEDSELGEIPEGWEVKQLDDLADIQGGKQLSSEECNPTGVFPVFGANGIMGYAERSTHEGFVIAFGRVGAYCGSVHSTYSGAWINNNASSVMPRRWSEFVLQAMLMADFDGMRTGSAQPFIPNSSLASLQVVRPPDTVLDEFCSAVRSLRLREQASQGESRTLAALRDTLLPKLISGEVRIPDAERIAGAAA